MIDSTDTYNPEVNIEAAIGPYTNYCGGTVGVGPSGSSYVTAVKLAAGLCSADGLDDGTARIVSGDRCRVAGSYVGQTNFLIATSYTGRNGVIWGLDVAAQPKLAGKAAPPSTMFEVDQPFGPPIPVWPIGDLMEASRQLLGTRDSRFGSRSEKRFPPLPGLQLVSAYKSGAGYGPGWAWSILALAELEDRSTGSCLFNEDGGVYGNSTTSKHDIETFLSETFQKIGRSIVACGENHGVRYGRIFMGGNAIYIPDGYYGCAIACAPYLTLAQHAVPKGWSPAALGGVCI